MQGMFAVRKRSFPDWKMLSVQVVLVDDEQEEDLFRMISCGFQFAVIQEGCVALDIEWKIDTKYGYCSSDSSSDEELQTDDEEFNHPNFR